MKNVILLMFLILPASFAHANDDEVLSCVTEITSKVCGWDRAKISLEYCSNSTAEEINCAKVLAPSTYGLCKFEIALELCKKLDLKSKALDSGTYGDSLNQNTGNTCRTPAGHCSIPGALLGSDCMCNGVQGRVGG